MNSISLFVTASQLVLRDCENNNNLTELYRVLPDLRQTLLCVVCRSLLVNPHAPIEANCQHNLCKLCVPIRQKTFRCCITKDYSENRQLYILIQCYKSLCEHLKMSLIYKKIQQNIASGILIKQTKNLLDVIDEGLKYQPDGSVVSESPSTLTIIKCQSPSPAISMFTVPQSAQIQPDIHLYQQPIIIPLNISTGQLQFQNEQQLLPNQNSTRVSMNSRLYSPTLQILQSTSKSSMNCTSASESFKEPLPPLIKIFQPKPLALPSNICAGPSTQIFPDPVSVQNDLLPNKRNGCRCGNATITPGNLTCCGQRCLCYINSKACIDCKCRGCRNPYLQDGYKILPNIVKQTIVTPNTDARKSPTLASSLYLP